MNILQLIDVRVSKFEFGYLAVYFFGFGIWDLGFGYSIFLSRILI